MAEQNRELSELKREVVESRNQAIKTDNQLRNLAFEVKGFERRFDNLESRVRLSGIGATVIVGGAIALAATIVLGVRSHAYEAEILALKDTAREEHQQAQAHSDELKEKLTALEQNVQAQHEAAKNALRVLTLLDARQDKEASGVLDNLDVQNLTELERRACGKRFDELRQRQAEASYRNARRLMLDGQWAQAVPELQRTLKLNPDGRFSETARYHLVWALWTAQRYSDAEPLARNLARHKDAPVAEEGRYLLATTLARLERRDEARTLLQQIVAADGRFVVGARAYLTAMSAALPLPQDLPGGRVRVARRPSGAPNAPGPAAPVAPGTAAPGAAPAAASERAPTPTAPAPGAAPAATP